MRTREEAIDVVEKFIDGHDYENASIVLKEMVKQYPDDFYLTWRLGHVLGSFLGRWAEAVPYLERSVGIEPQNAMAWGFLAQAYFELSQWRRTINALRKRVAFRETVSALVLLAHALRKDGCLAESEKSCRRAIELDPTYDEAYFNLGLALRSQHKIAEAIEAFEKTLDLNPDDAVTLRELGWTHHIHGDNGLAKLFINQSMQIEKSPISDIYISIVVKGAEYVS